MRYVWGWVGMLFLATAALGQTFTVNGSIGWGTAVNENGKPGIFRYDVRKVINNDTQRETLRGMFHFATGSREEHVGVSITLLGLVAYRQQITGDGRTAEFGGPAVLSITTPRGGKRVRGHLVVVVKDNRPPNVQEGEPDHIALRFVSGDSRQPFTFQGKVTRGDVAIFERQLPR